jgi:hypothetical protein
VDISIDELEGYDPEEEEGGEGLEVEGRPMG